MANKFLSNKNFKGFINKLKIDEEQKNALTLKVVQMDEAERLEFLDVLKDIYLLDLEESEAIEKLKTIKF